MIIKEKIYIEPLELERNLHIYIPKNIKKDERLPVLYMFDGHNLFKDEDSTYGKSWGLENSLDNTNARLIVVGIECNHEGNMRLSEFSPYTFSDKYWGYIEGKGKVLIDWIINSLKPYIDTKYPTIQWREATGIGGSSMGGLMALYAVVMRSDIFSKGACLSIFYDHIFKYLFNDVKNTNSNSDTKVYISWGRYEYRDKKQLAIGTEENLAIARILTEKRLQVFPHLMIEGRHNETSWEKENYLWLSELGFI
ncbi:alpha/beta hydrolase [Fusobacterium sp. PH5-44]|uniref:alpha/beta hydrolase n=1 Tax=unclassified Fusobacterium TaxID=2648384 RepID=UPI003D23215F